MHETFWTLLRDPAHWEFELFLMLVFDGLIVGLLWPFVRVHWRHHIARDEAAPDWSMNPIAKAAGHVKDPWTAQTPRDIVYGTCLLCEGPTAPFIPGLELCRGCGDVRCSQQEGGQ